VKVICLACTFFTFNNTIFISCVGLPLLFDQRSALDLGC
jgi:hypothetical protein